MLLAWVHAFLLSNMLLAGAYGSGGCFWDNGHLYREDQPSPAPGLRCLNWLAAQGGRESPTEPSECPPGEAGGVGGRRPRPLTSLLSASGPGNHNYCRNPDQDPRGPWCYISSETGVPEKRPCEDVRCPETTSQAPAASTSQLEEKSDAPGDEEAQVFPPANVLPARSEAAEVQPVIGISQRVRMNSKEKKDLGTLGYVLGITMMVIIIAIGVGIILGYTYKRGKDLKDQHEQKVCEREMQRITLPLSAFTNPTCETTDEKTIIVHSNQTPADPQEGSTLLVGQAGTPGA
ncbi:phosphoinositide-3-kinase-interacting protein 1 isoform X1 [Peromyscus eremicus]|uniref:phosphoinositide-3-kinase-interacting protein 1 isoform X1 n=1 Tax=Peromyscus eremicus TaxID=42410 RepID=UPI0027DD44B5|nr:phosphoinositide-3-kinase-interacting protein 1 isoform X1 [Peromyscus eremicus]